MRLATLFRGCLATMAVASAQAQGTDPPRLSGADAAAHVGTVATLCGQVTTYHCARPDAPTFLDFDTPYWSDGVSVRIPATVRALFEPRVEDVYSQRRVCATGRIARDGQRSVVDIDGPGALQLDGEQPPLVSMLDGGAVRSCDPGVELPRPVRQSQPDYTRAAVVAGIEGSVLLEGVVLPTGAPGEIRVLQSLDPGLDREAIRAFRSWRFTAGRKDGRPARVVVTVLMHFTLHDR